MPKAAHTRLSIPPRCSVEHNRAACNSDCKRDLNQSGLPTRCLRNAVLAGTIYTDAASPGKAAVTTTLLSHVCVSQAIWVVGHGEIWSQSRHVLFWLRDLGSSCFVDRSRGPGLRLDRADCSLICLLACIAATAWIVYFVQNCVLGFRVLPCSVQQCCQWLPSALPRQLADDC